MLFLCNWTDSKVYKDIINISVIRRSLVKISVLVKGASEVIASDDGAALL